MFNPYQFRDLIRRVLRDADLYSESAEELLFLTAAVESKLGTYIRQMGHGPALGVFQMEPATEDDIFGNYLAHREDLTERVVWPYVSETSGGGDLEWNLAYQIIMARIHYLRVPTPLPEAWDIYKLAEYWKDHYNTHLGAGTVEKATQAYQECGGAEA